METPQTAEIAPHETDHGIGLVVVPLDVVKACVGQLEGNGGARLANIVKGKLAGLSDFGACGCAGIPLTVVQDWLRVGAGVAAGAAQGIQADDAGTRMALLYEGWMAACAVVEGRRVGKIEAATDWRAPAWLLERQNPEVYGRRSVLEVGGTGTPISMVVGAAGAAPRAYNDALDLEE